MIRASISHLVAADETYFEHMRFALTVGALTVGAGLACLLHAVVPGLCQTTCSRTISALTALFADRRRLRQIAEQCSGVTAFTALTLIALAGALVAVIAGAGSPFAWVVALQAVALPMLYVVQNPALDALEA
jgi:hypothetical protein